MSELVKIRDVSERYDISARTLRYYEDMGLISSIRSDDYAYRLYDEAAVKKLEQILILRKLNISIKDIRRIFHTSGTEVVLEVLGRKVSDIDGEISLLNELKEIVLAFIRQIERADFSNASDVKMLYENAREIETRLVNVDYNGNPSNVNRLLEVTEKLAKMPEVRIVQIHPFKAFTSGQVTPDVVFGEFQTWQETQNNRTIRNMIYGAQDFLWFEEDGTCEWIWAVEDWVMDSDVKPYSLIEFEGGLYAAAMSIDGDDASGSYVYERVKKWIEASSFELDERPRHRTMCHMINPTKEIKEALGYHQLDIYVPIKIREPA
ncbi:MAG: MerR family transcriptional regulator [Oscillospiraceae bacterium]|jgi:DNA-binding transcriptional MerR regulator|nr:MerR family transcriptional regulator [Oscillospiraceae bacterium]